tara:strand:+ start:49 stop:1500 length:1452 start_codon:yes stop_codon:yes gene_type:complete
MSEPLHRIVPYERQFAQNLKSDILTDIFIENSKKKHGDKYDYSKSKYEHNLKEVIIICPEHGKFKQLPKVHKRGGGCQDCGRIKTANGRRSNTDKFIEDAKKIHGDKYNYSKVDYKSAREPVTIICKKHDEFSQTPNGHLSKEAGCRKCSTNTNAIKATKSTTQFIEDAKKIHGETYDYSKVDYKSAREPVTIICKKHDEFSQTPNGHLSKKRGCRRCGIKKITNTKEFIEEAKKIHGETYDYSKVEYKISMEPVTLICKTHGDFQIRPNGHINKYGCFKCGHNMKIFSTNEFIEEAQQIHGDTYDYSKVVYSKMTGKVKIICRNCNEEFEQTASNHITHRQGCSCFKKKTETKLHDALKQIYSTIIKEFKKSWCKNKRYLPFDFCIPELKIIIELDGKQHFCDINFFPQPFIERHERDVYKEKCANENGYHTIRILQEDVWYGKNDWLENLLREIEYIKNNQYDIHNRYICDNNEYDIFIES